MIKINLIREGRSPVKGAAAPGASAVSTAGGAANLNNILVVGLLVLGLLASAGYWFYRHSELKRKEEEKVAKQAEAQKLEAIIKEVEDFERRKVSLEKRIATINDLKKNQKGPVRIMDRVSQDLPDLVWIDHMALQKGIVSLDGRGLNPTAIATFIENVKGDPLFQEPDVSAVTQASTGTGSQSVYTFGMSFSFKVPTAADANVGEAGTSTSTTGTSATGVTTTSGTTAAPGK
ncbi:MAG TPA: PilN domain-containing protein [Thermoanaerobaculia bacterium]|nr:PilN domain-containing protein [Thermoanaerobaculia bacterium]